MCRCTPPPPPPPVSEISALNARLQPPAMGGNFFTKIALWTFWFLLCSVKNSVNAIDQHHQQDLGFAPSPDASKINISQDEYTRMMSVYLERLQDSQQPESIPKLFTFNSERNSWRRRRDDTTRLRFPVKPSNTDVGIENAELRLLLPEFEHKHSIRVKVYQVLSPRRRRLLSERRVYPSQSGPKWCEFEVTEAVQSWMNGQRNLGLDLECVDCRRDTFRLLEAALSALAHPDAAKRKKRSYEEAGRTDCAVINHNTNKPKCCRHEMVVTFKKLDLSSIIQPKSFEAGFCKGRCPLNYNHATNHSRIQNLVHRLDRKATPRACCAPSKLEPLEILRVDPNDATKLSVEKWDNMRVLECACS